MNRLQSNRVANGERSAPLRHLKLFELENMHIETHELVWCTGQRVAATVQKRK